MSKTGRNIVAGDANVIIGRIEHRKLRRVVHVHIMLEIIFGRCKLWTLWCYEPLDAQPLRIDEVLYAGYLVQ